MALQVQSMFAAAGDFGAYDNESNLSVDDPGSQPFVVSVGGTHLEASGGSYVGESTWNAGSPEAGAGGGGVSAVWTEPGWQSGVATGQNMASSTMRNVPDVSLNADPAVGYAVFVAGSWQVIGGTSCGAPLWAAFTALVNQARAEHGLGNLGFPDPGIYAIGKGSRYSADFHDIQDGSNNLYYPAIPGFDDATGWGTINGQNLFQDLSTEPAATASDLSC
jgi:kumamolisin